MSENEKWLLRAAERAREYLAELSSGQRSFNSAYQDISVGRELAAAIEAVKAERDSARMIEETRF